MFIRYTKITLFKILTTLLMLLLTFGIISIAHPQESIGDELILRKIKYDSLLANGQYDQIIVIEKKALKKAEEKDGINHSSVAAILQSLAILYHYQGQYEQSESLFNRAMAIWERNLNSLNVPTQDNIVYQSRYIIHIDSYPLINHINYDALFNHYIWINEKIFGQSHPKMATKLNIIAMLYIFEFEGAKAEPLFKRALAIREKAYGQDHQDVATSLNNLAVLYYDQKQYTKADPLFNRSLTIREKVLGLDNPDIAMSLNNLALVYRKQKKYSQAESLFKRALAIREKVLGPEHTYVANSLYYLALMYKEQQFTYKYFQAEPLLRRALDIRKKTLGENHQNVIEIRRSLNEVILQKVITIILLLLIITMFVVIIRFYYKRLRGREKTNDDDGNTIEMQIPNQQENDQIGFTQSDEVSYGGVTESEAKAASEKLKKWIHECEKSNDTDGNIIEMQIPNQQEKDQIGITQSGEVSYGCVTESESKVVIERLENRKIGDTID